MKIEISKETKRLGTAGPLLLLEDELTEPFLVMNGDILTLVDFKKMYDFAIEQNSLLTVSVKKEITPFAFGNIDFEGDFVTNIQEKPDIEMFILAGIYIMKPDIFKYFPKDEYFGMDTLILDMLEKKDPISKHLITEYWLDIGKVADYEKAQEIYEEHFKN